MEQKTWMKDVISIIKIVIGCFIYALSVVWFIDPAGVIPGSITGVGIVVKAVTGFPIGQLNLIINIPLLIIGTIVLGKRCLIYTGLTVFLTSVMMDGLAFLQPFTSDILLASIFGGVVMGVGLGLILDGGGSTGGTSLVGQLISKKYPHIPMGDILLVGDFIIIMAGSIVLKNWDRLLYSLIDLYICVVVINLTMYGYKTSMMTVIHTKKREELIQELKKANICRIVYGFDTTVGVISKKKNVSKIQAVTEKTDESAYLASYQTDYSFGNLYKDYSR